MRSLVAFGRFWYDFIVGDSAVLAVGGAATLVAGYLLARAAPAAAEVALPALVLVTLALSFRPAR